MTFYKHLKHGQAGGVKEIKQGFAELEILRAILRGEIKRKQDFPPIISPVTASPKISNRKWLKLIQQVRQQVPAEPDALFFLPLLPSQQRIQQHQAPECLLRIFFKVSLESWYIAVWFLTLILATIRLLGILSLFPLVTMITPSFIKVMDLHIWMNVC